MSRNVRPLSGIMSSEYCRPLAAIQQLRVFDINRCVCGGPLKIIAAIEDPIVVVRILTHLGLPARETPRAPTRAAVLYTAYCKVTTTVL